MQNLRSKSLRFSTRGRIYKLRVQAVLQNFFNSGWRFPDGELFLKHRYNMVNITLLCGFIGLTQGMVYNIISGNKPLIYIELVMYGIVAFLFWLLRQKKEYYEHVTSLLALVTLIFFDLLILFSKPEDFKFIWLFVYSTVFIFFKGNKIGLFWLGFMYLTVAILKLQPFVELHYSASQLLYFIIVSLILNAIIIYFQYVMENSQRMVLEQKEQLQQANNILQHVSVTDQLTGIYNRTKLDSVLKSECQRTIRYERECGLILLDIDHFKRINDTHGHQCGDEVLYHTAKIIEKSIRETDILGRWGGEEFMIICPETDRDGVHQLSETIRRSINDYNFPVIEQNSASFGMTVFQNGDTIESVIKRADDALYRAKGMGRNCVAVS